MENIQDIYPLSPMQEGMLFHTIYSPESDLYKEQFSCKLSGDLQIDLFKEAWDIIIDRYDILRTGFIWEDIDNPLQIVYKNVELPFQYEDISDLREGKKEEYIQSLKEDNLRKAFNIADSPLMRIFIVKISNGENVFIWDYHHILFDGWSLPILMEELMATYRSLANGDEVNLNSTFPYKSYIAWLKNQDEEKAEQFWTERLDGLTNPVNLNFPFKHKPYKGYLKERISLSDKLSKKIVNISKKEQLTINTIFQSAWALVLSYYTGEDDIVFGATLSGRNADLPGIEKMVGLLINTLPVRIKVDKDQKVIDWLNNNQLIQSALHEYEYSPLFKVQKWCQVPKKEALFDTILVFENYPVDKTLNESKELLKISDLHSVEKTNYPLTLIISPGELLGVEIAYDTEKYDTHGVKEILKRFHIIIENLFENIEKPLSQLSFTLKEELSDFYNFATLEPSREVKHMDLIGWFEEMVRNSGSRTAIVSGKNEITYNELNKKANQIAHYLRSNSISVEDIVGVCVERSIDAIAAILAVNKTGAAVVPIDVNYPVDRIKYIAGDSNLKMLITTKPVSERISSLPNIVLIEELNNNIDRYETSNLNVRINGNNLAYVIYTSGSTGKPKGVCIEHYPLCYLTYNTIHDYGFSNPEKILQFASFGFDAAIAEIFLSLLSGSTLFIPEKDTILSIKNLINFINKSGITFSYFPPSYLSLADPNSFKNKIKIVSVGDKCTAALAEKWGSKTIFYNGYGPTEATIGATLYKYDKNDNFNLSVPIGKGFGNTRIYILDENLNFVSIGVSGEMYIAGKCIGRGYFNMSDTTAEKYLPDLYSDIPGQRMYRTGDIGKYLPDGNIEFVGRRDFQVKLRGFRIELNEIEAVMQKHELVKDCAVTAMKESEGNEYLIGYVIPNGEIVDTEILLEFIKKELPEYMIPRSITILNEFPLTPNKKIDRKRLPKPEVKISEEGIIHPITSTEEIIANIWSDILGIEEIGRNSNFFELGGHSLLATQLISRLRETFNKDISFKSIFESIDLKDLANYIDSKLVETAEEGIKIEKRDLNNNIPLSFSQQRLWFLDQLKPNDPSYNIPAAIRIKGEVNADIIEKALNLIIKKHEILRTSFYQIEGRPYQQIADEFNISIKKTNIEHETHYKIINEIRNAIAQRALVPFDLSKLPLLNCELFKINDNDYVLFLLMHHIISDGWSITILINEFMSIYSSLIAGDEPVLNDLDIQYADYTLWQQKHFKGSEYNRQMDFWKEKLKDAPPILELPYDKPKPKIQSSKSEKVDLTIDFKLVEGLKNIMKSENATLFMTLFSIFQLLLSKYSNMDDVVVGTPIAGRNNTQIEKLIGFFVNNLALRTSIYAKNTFRELLVQVRKNTLEGYTNQSIPFEKIVEEIQPVRDLSHQPIFQVMFVFQNLPTSEFKLQNMEILPFEIESQMINYDLTLTVQESGTQLIGNVEYNSDLFEKETVIRFIEHYKTLISIINKDPDIQIEDIILLTSTEKELVYNKWNSHKNDYLVDSNVVQKFEDTVEQNRNEEAVVFRTIGDGKRNVILTYKELNERANKLAHFIHKLGVRIEDRIAICMNRHEDMITSIFAILKTGCAFVPIDPSLPLDRIKYMIQAAGCKKVICNNVSCEKFENIEIEIINHSDSFNDIGSEEAENLNIDIDLDNLAYIIFTSGSTGLPKGVMLNHRGLHNLSIFQKEAFEIIPNKKVMQFSSLSFDASVWETVMALLNGAALYLTSKEVISSGHELSQFIIENEITIITLPPSVLAAIPYKEMPALETLITAGEAVSHDLVRKWSTGRNYFNAYGPTETTVCASIYRQIREYYKGPPIGKAISNFELYILDKNMHPVGIGIPGELCIGGIGLARGYIGQPDLTAEKFIPNNFSDKKGARLYRSGDLAKYLQDGNIEFLGRIDSQVKVRGFRIEIGEIEENLKKIDLVEDAVVVLVNQGTSHEKLVAYIICPASDFNKEEIIINLKEKLPDYMIPAVYINLEQMPLTTSGKIDKQALRNIKLSREELGTEYIAPRNEDEQKLVKIVEELLDVDKVGVKDNFFELGGHSLLATQFISRIREVFNTEVSLLKLFEEPTIEGLYNNIQNSAKNTDSNRPTIKKISRDSRRIKRTDIN